jgi:hypothetical protein
MAGITGTVRLTAQISPMDDQDDYGLTNPKYGLGGLRSVGSTANRNSITSKRREVGMMVYVDNEDKFYYLQGGTANANWKEVTTNSNVSKNSSRTAIQISADGFSAGNLVNFNIQGNGFTKCQANNNALAEFIGIIEGISGNTATVITNGSISWPTNGISFTSGDGGSGGNDVWFMSAMTAGAMQNSAPGGSGDIVKPVYLHAPHTGIDGSTYTGIILTYTGYRNPS